MKKILLVMAMSLFFVNLKAQKSSGIIKDNDQLSVTIKKMNESYANNQHQLWDEKLSDDAKVYLNNTLVDGKTVKEIFKSHHTIFNDIQIVDIYVHTNYFERDEIWSNNWFTWMGTGNKTGIRFSNRAHFDFKWENGKIIELLCYFDSTGLNMEFAAID